MIRSIAEDFEVYGCRLLHSRRSRLGGRNYRFEVDSRDRVEVAALSKELAERISAAMPKEYPARLNTEASCVKWFASRQTYRFTIRVWVEFEQLYLPGMEDLA